MRNVYFKIGIVLLVLVAGAAWTVHHALEGVHNAYAVWWVADMTILHMEANQGQWPHGWDDLIDDYETMTVSFGRPWTFDELRRRVIIDWKADPVQLASAAKRGERFRVIWLADGSNNHYSGHEPNEKLAIFFRDQKPN